MYLHMCEMCKIKNQVKESIASHYQLLAVRRTIQKVGMQIYWSMVVMGLTMKCYVMDTEYVNLFSIWILRI